jgi:tRNA A37 threonylcarbamoyladenosine biosynthesis protein TsaE
MQIMEEVGELISVVARPPDVLYLDGDLGAGKTTFARGFIRCKLGAVVDNDGDAENKSVNSNANNTIQVTSPTYLLSNTYAYREEDDDVQNCISGSVRE